MASRPMRVEALRSAVKLLPPIVISFVDARSNV